MASKGLVVLSGGQDSTTCLYWAKENYDEVHAITFDYNQRHSIEISAAIKIAAMAEVKSHDIVAFGPILKGRSPLTDPNATLEKYDSYQEMDTVIGQRRELTFVPMRNALFLTIAANRAEVNGISEIVTGVCQMDNANYDDCRDVFISAAERYINTALGHDHRETQDIHIVTPLLRKTKAETVKLAMTLPGCYTALAYSHTSYDGCYPPTDNNHSNVLRAQGFLEAGVPDPLVLRAWYANLMCLPDTTNYSRFSELTPKSFSDFEAVLNFILN
jgi:7-cyano-7-deazaguanine synthase